MIVEPAAPADLSSILALEEHFGVRWSEESWLSELSGEGRLVLAARVDGELVGVACFQRLAEVVDLHRIVVAPSQRRLGLARAMLVEHDNEPAIALYRGYGFRPIAARADYYGPGADAVIMERPLEGVDADSVGMWDMEEQP
jgi:ribosomal protein S18 acetylase RimI-like enzyme